MIGIYKITNPVGDIYIGKSNNIKKRWSDYSTITDTHRKISKSFITYGYINHTFEIIELCNEEQLFIREKYYIELYNAIEIGLNSKQNNKLFKNTWVNEICIKHLEKCLKKSLKNFGFY
jgi:group I intron endonuclease